MQPQRLEPTTDNFFPIKHEDQFPDLRAFLKDRQYNDVHEGFDRNGAKLFSLRLYGVGDTWTPAGIICVTNQTIIAKVGAIIKEPAEGGMTEYEKQSLALLTEIRDEIFRQGLSYQIDPYGKNHIRTEVQS
jgi:hypothetical protein